MIRRNKQYVFVLIVLALVSVNAYARLCADIFLSSEAPAPYRVNSSAQAVPRSFRLQPSQKIGEYSVLTVEVSPLARAQIKLIVDVRADWLARAFYSFTNKAIESADVGSIRKFLNSLASMPELANLANSKARAFRADVRTIFIDSQFYYLEELLSEPDRKDLALSILGQALLSNFTKKSSQAIAFTMGESKEVYYGLLIDASEGLVFSTKCPEFACQAAVPLRPLVTEVVTPELSKDKSDRFFQIVDEAGNSHKIKIVGRSPTERLIKNDQQFIDQAKDNDLVPIEYYFMSMYYPGGTNMLRIGDTIYHFGFEGWEAKSGSEGVKGFLFSSPYLRSMRQMYSLISLPPFNIGLTFFIPKKQVQQLTQALQAKVLAPAEEKDKFDFLCGNCSQRPLQLFAEAGINLAETTGFAAFSSSISVRNMILHPRVPIYSIAVYPVPGVELSDSQYRSLFPQALYRAHSIRNDRVQTYISADARETLKEAMVLMILAKAQAGTNESTLAASLVATQLFDETSAHESLQQLQLRSFVGPNWELTSSGMKRLSELALDYNLENSVFQ